MAAPAPAGEKGVVVISYSGRSRLQLQIVYPSFGKRIGQIFSTQERGAQTYAGRALTGGLQALHDAFLFGRADLKHQPPAARRRIFDQLLFQHGYGVRGFNPAAQADIGGQGIQFPAFEIDEKAQGIAVLVPAGAGGYRPAQGVGRSARFHPIQAVGVAHGIGIGAFAIG